MRRPLFQGPIFPIAIMALAITSLLMFIDISTSPAVNQVNQNKSVACTDEAKICPDGSAVGRTGLNCQFAACPEPSNQNAPTNISTGNTNVSRRAETGCVITGCSGEVCSNHEVVTDCVYREEYSCYQTTSCAKKANGTCGWDLNATARACLDRFTPPVTDQE